MVSTNVNTPNDRWLCITSIAVIWIVSMAANHLLVPPFTVLKGMQLIISLVSISVTWLAMRSLFLFFRKRYPAKQDSLKRVVITFLIGSLVSAVMVWLTGMIRNLILFGSLANLTQAHSSITVNGIRLELNIYGLDLVRAATTFLLFQGIYETLFFANRSQQYQQQLKQARQESEKLRMLSLQSQLDTLKQQVNPHFLFNSLNALGSLIEEDPMQARVFLEELSTVYRYLLRANEQNLTSLSTELDFIHSYYHLLKTRYGAGLSLDVRVGEAFQTHLLPPLTLQLLVENAVKHNVVSADQPLCIRISVNENGHLTVCNTLQRKMVRVQSTGIGLTNILTKYQMLGKPAPIVQETDNQFVVSIPLLAAEA